MPNGEIYKGVPSGERQIAKLSEHNALYEYEFAQSCTAVCTCIGTRGQNILDASYGGKFQKPVPNTAIHIDVFSSIATNPMWGDLT